MTTPLLVLRHDSANVTINHMTETITARGRNGQISFDGKTVTIDREGALPRATHGRSQKQIALRQITAVQIKPVSLLTSGFIQITVPGETSKNRGKGGRTFDAAADENSVLFLKKSQTEFEALRDAIVKALAAL